MLEFSHYLPTTIIMLTTVKSFLVLFFSLCFAVHSAEPLSAKEAFKPSVKLIGNDSIDIHIEMPKGFYIYRETRFGISENTDGVAIKNISLSPGIIKKDDFFGEQSVWYGGKKTADINLTYDNPKQLKKITIMLQFQGCQDGLICYPPQKIPLEIDLPAVAKTSATNISSLQNKKSIFKNSSPVGKSSSSSFVVNKTKSNGDLLSEDDAFPFSIDVLDATTLQLRFQIAEDYYLYRDKIKVVTSNADEKDLISDVKLTNGINHYDEFKGDQMIYRGEQIIGNIYLSRPAKDLNLSLEFQGCAEKIGICYPLMKRDVNIKKGLASHIEVAISTNASVEETLVDKIALTLLDNLWTGVGLLLVAGIALSFTPCVLPMLPILLSIITNQRKVSKPRAFMLSSSYGLGVAVMMAVVGLVVSMTGINIQIIFQQPLWLIVFASLFISMGLAMLGVFNIAMPSGVQMRVIQWQNKFKDTNAPSVFIVGALSTLVVGPCIAPPLIAILAFISTTGDRVLGAIYLFSLGIGMSLPLVIFASLVTTVPKTGALSQLVTRVFAMLMFGVGLWLLGRLWSGSLSLMFWGVFLFVLAVLFWYSGFVKPHALQLVRACAAAFALIGCIWLIGGAMGNSNPLKPFTKVTTLPFKYVSDIATLNKALTNSKKPVLLDIYADWCVSCQEVEHFTLTDPKVAEALEGLTLIKLDISKTSDAHHEILAQYGLIGPPVMLFFEKGREIKAQRHVGAIKAEALLNKINQML